MSLVLWALTIYYYQSRSPVSIELKELKSVCSPKLKPTNSSNKISITSLILQIYDIFIIYTNKNISFYQKFDFIF